jgi:hypothetical protein
MIINKNISTPILFLVAIFYLQLLFKISFLCVAVFFTFAIWQIFPAEYTGYSWQL